MFRFRLRHRRVCLISAGKKTKLVGKKPAKLRCSLANKRVRLSKAGRKSSLRESSPDDRRVHWSFPGIRWHPENQFLVRFPDPCSYALPLAQRVNHCAEFQPETEQCFRWDGAFYDSSGCGNWSRASGSGIVACINCRW